MRAIQFETTVDESGRLAIPDADRSSLPSGTRAQVIVLVPDDGDITSQSWDQFAARNIADYFDPEDAIYDDHPRG